MPNSRRLHHRRRATTRLLPLALALRLARGGLLALGCAAIPAHAQAQSPATLQFDVAAGPLAGALNRFAQQAGVTLALDADKVQGLQSAGLKGAYAIDDGFNVLLRESPFVIARTGDGYVLQAKPPARPPVPLPRGEAQLPAVSVTGARLADELPDAYAGGQVARGGQLGMLGNTDVMDAPFNISSYTAQLIEDQQASTIAAVLLNDPSVRFTTSEGHIYENFSIRGFEINGEDLAFNGLYGLAPYGHAPTEFIERVEVMKGPSALLGGMSPQGAVGGVVNLVPKRAGAKPLFRLNTDYTSDSQLGVHLDAGQRFGDGQRYGVRVNGGYRDGKVGVDGQKKERVLGSVALDYRGERLAVSLDAYSDQEHIDNGSSWMAAFPASGVLKPPATGTNLLRGIYGKLDNQAALARATYEFSDDISVYAGIGALRYRYAGYINGTRAAIRNAAGDFTGNTFHQRGSSDTVSAEAGLRARFATGAVRHQLVFGLTSLDYDSGRANPVTSASYASNIYRSVAPSLAADPGAAPHTGETTLSSIALADTLSLAQERVLLTVGARRQQVRSKTFNPANGALTSDYDKRALTPALALVLKPWARTVSLYANYIEGLSQGGTVTDVTAKNYGTVFAPYKSRQMEAGLKWDRDGFGNSVSMFQIKRPSMVKNVANNTYDADGQQRNRGVEWNVFGQLGRQWRLLGGAAYTEGKLTHASNTAFDGNTAYGTPKWKANLGAEWDVPTVPALTLVARLIYTGEQYINTANTQQIDGWTRYDVGARFATRLFDRPVQLRAHVDNLFDKSYWAGSFNDGYVTQGAGRIYKLSAAVDF